jgi:hypothetical protein
MPIEALPVGKGAAGQGYIGVTERVDIRSASLSERGEVWWHGAQQLHAVVLLFE